MKGPIRRVVRLVNRQMSRQMVHAASGRPYTSTWHESREVLECGHLLAPPMGLHGTTIGYHDSRRCPFCAADEAPHDLTGWSDL